MGTKPLVAVVIPRLGRNDRVQRVWENIVGSTDVPIRVIWVVSRLDDHQGIENELVCGKHGWAAKINYAYEHTTEPYIFCGADDLNFHRGWLERCLETIDDEITERDNWVGAVGTNDLGNLHVMVGNLATHVLVTRTYADVYGTMDESGKIFHEYPHTYPDEEFTLTAKARDKFLYNPQAVVEHMHPFWNKAPWDDTYELGKKLNVASQNLWYLRLPRLVDFVRDEVMRRHGIQGSPSPESD